MCALGNYLPLVVLQQTFEKHKSMGRLVNYLSVQCKQLMFVFNRFTPNPS